MIVPMQLEEYEEVRRWAPLIVQATQSGYMPPWGAHEQHNGTFIGERYLTAEEKATLKAWAEAGTPAGDPADARPAPMARNSGDQSSWWIGDPDLVLTMPEKVHVADEVQDWQPSIEVPVPEGALPEPRWIKRSEWQFGRPWVHHAVNRYVGAGVPGRGPFTFPEGFSLLIPENPRVSLSMHYYKKPGPGTAFEDLSRVGFDFYQPGEVIDYIVQDIIPSANEQAFLIPAGDPNFEVNFTHDFEEDTYLISMAPHSHLRGKAFKYELETPDGQRETLLWVPNYSAYWQHNYQFKEPRLIRAGSKLHGTWWFDNSDQNPRNPDPAANVTYGMKSTDEMANARIYFAPAVKRGIVAEGPIPEDILEKVRQAQERENARREAADRAQNDAQQE